MSTAPKPKRRFWRACRIYFRRLRLVVWLVILLLVGALAYLNQVGLPDFVKKPLLETLRARGLDLRFSRLRLRWYNGIVAENVRFGRTDEPLSPHLTVSEVLLQLDHHALMRLQFQVESLVLRQGRLELPLEEANQPFLQLTADDIQTQLRLLPGDRWELDDFTARFAGARIQLAGTIENASTVRQWKFLMPGQPATAGTWQ